MLTRRDIVGGLAFSAGLATWSGRGLGQAEAEPFKVVAFWGLELALLGWAGERLLPARGRRGRA
jgi:hypothetical protein